MARIVKKRRPFIKKPKKCYFTENKVEYIDYKELNVLGRFINDRGKIKARKTTGTKPVYQRELAKAIKKSRHMALMPYVRER